MASIVSVNSMESGVNDQSRWASNCKDWDDWDKAGPPFKIFANTFYVGTCGIASILITGDQGHILIDGATQRGSKIIKKNIRSLGFDLKDIKVLLHSHEHFDHVGGLAALQDISGAEILTSPLAKPVISSGILSEGDPQFGMHKPFAPARVDGTVNDGASIDLGAVSVTPIFTPGHTPGALSWSWISCEKKVCKTLVYGDSLFPVSSSDYKFSDHPVYLATYFQGIRRLMMTDCDILLTPHPSASQMRSRILSKRGLQDGGGCKSYGESILSRLDKRLIKEKGKKQ